jgi:hypothetical protein
MYDCGQTGEVAAVWARLIRMAFLWRTRAVIAASGVHFEGLPGSDRL